MSGGFYCFIILAWTQGALTFNLDSSSPTVVFPESVGSEDFGFSIAQHEMPNNDKLLLVGSPKADYNGLTEGGVYSCQFRNGSNCTRLEAFNFRNDSGGNLFTSIISRTPSVIPRQFDGQLMGFTVHSSHGRVIACAPLFIHTVVSHSNFGVGDTNGRCILFPQNLNSSALKQVSSTTVSSEFQLAGVDAIVFNQDTATPTTNLAIGSVYKGTSRPRPGGVFSVNADSVSSNIQTLNPASVLNSEFRGYHVDSGHFAVSISQNVEEVVYSAPRANQHRGQITVLRPDTNSLVEVLPLMGTDPDGYFGYDFAMLDLNTNGYHSIAVGCPFCNRGRGRVTLYLHSGDPSNPVAETVQVQSPSQQTGRFGYSVESLGDINRDGYDDVAISAPYLISGGVVYIYTGSREGLVYSQTILPSSDVSGFGIALSAGVDVDNNGYPDLSISDTSGSQIVTIRSSPIVNVQLSILEGNDSRINYAEKNCVLGGIQLTCFNITPCFNFTTVYGTVAKFAVEYTLVVDEVQQRVGLINQALTNRVNKEITIDQSGKLTCASTHTFFLQPDFSSTDPIPFEVTANDATNVLPLPSSDSTQFGGPLHPVLNRLDEFGLPMTTTLRNFIIPEFVVNCGNDSICDPVYDINLGLDGNRTTVPLAAAHKFTVTVTLSITEEDSLAAFLIVTMPTGIQFTDSDSITDLALSNCESSASNAIQCNLKNPITAGEIVKLNLTFQPNVRLVNLTLQNLIFNFTIRDRIHTQPLGMAYISIPTTSIASYDIRSSFGNETAQASRLLPTLNVSNETITGLGPTLIYQVTVSNSQRNDRGSPIPRTKLSITWPSVVTLSGRRQPLLVPTRLVIVGSDSTTCQQSNSIPNDLLSPKQQQFVLPNITEPVSIQHCPGRNISCGVIQCTIEHIQAQPSDNTTVAAPVQISIFATLWSFSVRESFRVSIYANVTSDTEYPEILSDSISNTTTFINVVPAVQEIMVDCLEPWVIAVSVIVGLLVVFLVTLCFIMFGFIGHGHFKRIKDKELRKRWEELHEIDGGGSLGTRIIPPIAAMRESKPKEEESSRYVEVELADKSRSGQGTDDLGPITDSTVLEDITLEGQIRDSLEGFSAELGIAGVNENDVETEI